MIQIKGILKSFGIIVSIVIILYLMIWILGHPKLVYWWKGEYLMGGFIALLIASIIMAIRSKKSDLVQDHNEEQIEQNGSVGKSIFRAILIAFGAILLFFYLVAIGVFHG